MGFSHLMIENVLVLPPFLLSLFFFADAAVGSVFVGLIFFNSGVDVEPKPEATSSPVFGDFLYLSDDSPPPACKFTSPSLSHKLASAAFRSLSLPLAFPFSLLLLLPTAEPEVELVVIESVRFSLVSVSCSPARIFAYL